jgi:hypothetical protein
MLATRKSEPRTMAAIWTFSMTVREMACHCVGEKAPKSHRKGWRAVDVHPEKEKAPGAFPKPFRQE